MIESKVTNLVPKVLIPVFLGDILHAFEDDKKVPEKLANVCVLKMTSRWNSDTALECGIILSWYSSRTIEETGKNIVVLLYPSGKASFNVSVILGL
jgi:hypothetical protein